MHLIEHTHWYNRVFTSRVIVKHVQNLPEHISELYTMKHRITYLRDAADPSFDPRQCLKVWKNSMRISDLHAAKEHRVTLVASELPPEVETQHSSDTISAH